MLKKRLLVGLLLSLSIVAPVHAQDTCVLHGQVFSPCPYSTQVNTPEPDSAGYLAGAAVGFPLGLALQAFTKRFAVQLARKRKTRCLRGR